MGLLLYKPVCKPSQLLTLPTTKAGLNYTILYLYDLSIILYLSDIEYNLVSYIW
jgi:hypothetical protein